MNKLLTAVVAALMIAGGLTAISGATPVSPRNNAVIVGEGSSPAPLSPLPDSACGDASSAVNQ